MLRPIMSSSVLRSLLDPRRVMVTVGCLVALAGPAAAAEGDVCKRARALLNEPFKGATDERCQQALDTAEEDKWQLWLDVAAADELTGDPERAALNLDRFVTAADKRGTRLPAQWVLVRDEARATIARLDGEVLRTKGRVTIITMPEGAELTFVGATRSGPAERTPHTRYFAPGSHIARLTMAETNATREISFTVAAGQTVALTIDLRPGAPTEHGVLEGPGPTVLGQRPDNTAEVKPDPGPIDEPVEPRSPEDPEDAALVRETERPWTRVGAVGVSLGVASLAAGVVFALQGDGLDAEAACSGAACEVDAPLRARVRADSEVAWDRATGAFIAGGVLVAGGILAIILDDDAPATATSYTTPRPRLTPWVSPVGAGLTGELRF